MIGPVLSLELLLGGRRGRQRAFRAVYAGWTALQTAALFFIHYRTNPEPTPDEVGRFVDLVFLLLALQHLLLIVVATPAFVAGAITDEKVQGTLQYLLTADLTSWEIIFGKLLGRFVQLLVIAVVPLPALAFLCGYGHRGWEPILGLTAITGALLALLGPASLWASVRNRKTSGAVLAVYFYFALPFLLVEGILHGGIDLLLYQFPVHTPGGAWLLSVEEFLARVSPIQVLEPLWKSHNSELFWFRFKVLGLLCGAPGLVFLTLSVIFLRPMLRRHLEGAVRPARRTLARPPVDEEPVRWHERTVGHGLLRWAGLALVFALSAGASLGIVAADEPTYFLFLGLGAGLVSSFICGVRTSGSVSGEREKDTWESLLITPMETWEIFWDKHTGTMESLYPFLLAYALPAVAGAVYLGLEAACFALSFLLLTWVGLNYMGAIGLYCSARSTSSWRSLIMTFAHGYGYGLGIGFLFTFAYLWLGCALGPLAALILALGGITNITTGVVLGVCICTSAGLSWFLYRQGQLRLSLAVSHVDSNERYGRTFARSLTRALRKYYEKKEGKQPEELFGPPPEPTPEAAPPEPSHGMHAPPAPSATPEMPHA